MGADTALSYELRRLRAAAGLTQEELAERAGISVRAVSDAERGLRGHLYPATAARLADALGLAGSPKDRFTALARGIAGPGGQLVPLPAPATPLLGRDKALDELTASLGDPSTRLVTLIGPGGVGKTRLAVAAAERCAPLFDDGVAFVQLASCRDADAAGLAIATAVGANVAHGTVTDMLCAAIGERRMLILCDTFEGVVGAAPLIAEVLARCRGTSVLATSRTPLRLLAERLMRVDPLEAPAAHELFVERARDARPGVDLSGSRELVTDICARVQGVPLAVELAAARVAHLGLGELRERLSHQLAILTGGPVDDDARHRTIEATVAWSYGLLGDAPADALAQLAVFDGWDLAAASAVLGRDALADVTALVDQSLAVAPSPTDIHGRYRMLDAVREFGAARLVESGEDAAAHDRHAAWFLRAAESAAVAMRQAGQHGAHWEASADLGNLRLAFRWFTDAGRAVEALRVATSLWMFWLWEGGFSEGRAWLRTALASADDADAALAARARWGAGWLAYHQGDYAEARIHASALRHLADAGGPGERRNALTLRGMIALADRRTAEAAGLLGEALAVAREIVGDPWLVAVSTLNDGAGLALSGHRDEAERRFVEARDRFAALGDETYRARALRHLAAVRLLAGDPGTARTCLDESLEIVRAADDRWGLAETLESRAHAAAVAGDVRGAGTLAARAAVLRRSLGVAPHPFDAILAERHLGPLRGAEAFVAGSREGTDGGELAWEA
ncbi:helix-turn-helix domain-containing protein [Sinomonas sp. ASV322]|uniref:ATP-binding protein n=1 Tax=Sinomonas sp. ASV322 TaxID=3041920 RepID=UPI0027DBD9E7|nr:helix-turn-helix domain-containing protein [Sinomonas sp. ASV322]MDQ4501772.1 helix-turn-helix domain-containing protein [Sinomonas sp. ASV322]